MRRFLLTLVGAVLLCPTAVANDPVKQDWLLCQAGHVERCNRILRAPIDDETRMLVEVDRQFAIEKVSAYARVLLQACNKRSNIRACDRALSYNLSATERLEVLTTRKAILDRGLGPVKRVGN